MTKDMILLKEKRPVLIQWAYDRVINKNLNVLAAMTGNPGSGKSYASLRWAELQSKKNGVEFSVDNIVFTPKEFIKLINSGNLKRGSVIIMDEAGVAINSRKWQSSINLMINKVIQTFRHQNYVVILNAPYFDFIDTAVRKMFHMMFEMDRIDFKKGVTWTMPKVIQINQRTGHVYYKWLRYKVAGEQPMALDKAGFNLSSKKLRIAYEKKKTDYTTKLNKDLEVDLDMQDSTKPKELTDMQKRIINLRNEYGLNEVNIGKVMGITQPSVNSHLKACKNKGFIVNRSKRDQGELPLSDTEKIREELKTKFKGL